MSQEIVYLTRRAVFSASHRLHSNKLTDAQNKEIFGKCNHINGHGHNYVLEVTVKGSIDENTGMVMDLMALKAVIDEVIMQRVDHKHFNLDVIEFATLNPTTENIVVTFWEWLEKALPANSLHELVLHETENNKVVYRG